ncbi:POL1 protein, partial [Cepphus grylle]|nr:POL1 protein [Cepphus grylle]
VPRPPPISAVPVSGPTIFTDASSQTGKAIATWRERDKWVAVQYRDTDNSVQWLEAKAIALAMEVWPNKPTNVCTDSYYCFRLVTSMAKPGWPGTKIALMLYTSLAQRSAPLYIAHVNGHQAGGGYFEGNRQADETARTYTLIEAKQLHERLHIGAKALAKECDIPLQKAREIVQMCPHCQK